MENRRIPGSIDPIGTGLARNPASAGGPPRSKVQRFQLRSGAVVVVLCAGIERVQRTGKSGKFVCQLLLMVLTILTPPAYAFTSEELSRRWSDPSSRSFGEDQLKPLVALMNEDPETNALLKEVLGKLGAGSPTDLLAILRLCPDLKGNERGIFTPSVRSEAFRNLDPPGEAKPWEPKVQEQLRSSFADREIQTDVMRLATWEGKPSICIGPGQSLLDSFLIFVHELTHFRGYRALEGEDILDFHDEEDYVRRTIEKEGGELDAYVAQWGAMKRLRLRVRIPLHYDIERFFDAYGRLIDRPGLEAHVLDQMGYRTRLKQDFRDKLGEQLRIEGNRLSWLREKLRPFLGSKLKWAEDNLDKARQQSQAEQIMRYDKLRVFYQIYLWNLDRAISMESGRIQQMEDRLRTTHLTQ